MLIGTYSNETIISDGMELRYYEYVENDSKAPESAGRFDNHLKFFTTEVREYILTKYSIKPGGKQIFYGCSNGGDYGLTLYAKHRDLFTDYICLSPVGTEAKTFKPEKTQVQRHYTSPMEVRKLHGPSSEITSGLWVKN